VEHCRIILWIDLNGEYNMKRACKSSIVVALGLLAVACFAASEGDVCPLNGQLPSRKCQYSFALFRSSSQTLTEGLFLPCPAVVT